tara:strand:+ start:315 stop:560 length:246 start_codon:yes stop_codon:yes gene_type:complete
MKAKLRRQKNKMMFHELENCPCGALKHNPAKIKRWNVQWSKHLAGLKKGQQKRIARSKLTKNPIIPVGMEYKDRHTWKKSK